MLRFFLVRLIARPLIWLTVAAVPVVAGARLYQHIIDPAPSPRATLGVNLIALSGILGALCVWLAARRSPAAPAAGCLPPSTALGSAQWAARQLPSSPAGLLIGRQPGWLHSALIRYDGDAHLLTLAPTGAGKGVGCVIPNLLTYRGSVLVTDPKGENFRVTARRRRELHHQVLALDPFGLVGGTAAFNPLDDLDPEASNAADDAAGLAELLLVREPRESGDSVFWSEEAKALLTGLILHAASDALPSRRTLRTVWELLSLPPRAMTQMWTAMGQSTAARGAVARAAARIRQKGDRVRSGILAQAQSQMHFLESPYIARVLDRSTFAFRDLATARLSIYLVLPPDRMDSCRRWLRLLVGCALNAVISARARGGQGGAERVLLLLDEFPALGAMPPLERAVALARGYGVTCWMLAQNVAQLRALYPTAWSTFVANAGVVQAFGTNDVETATYLSEMLGTTTVQTMTTTRSIGAPRRFFDRADCRDSWTVAAHARPLLSPDEVRRLEPDRSLVLMPAADPMCAARLDYRRDPEFVGLFDANPLEGQG